MARLEPFLPKNHGKPQVDKRRVVSGVIPFNRNGLCWRDAPNDHGRPKTLCNRRKSWSDKSVFSRMTESLAPQGRRSKDGNDRRDLPQGASYGH